LTQIRLDKTSKDKTSKDKTSKEEGESEGEPDPDRLTYWRDRVNFFRNNGWDPSGMYSLALNEGITREMIDGGKAS
jgi:hypothetical protein